MPLNPAPYIVLAEEERRNDLNLRRMMLLPDGWEYTKKARGMNLTGAPRWELEQAHAQMHEGLTMFKQVNNRLKIRYEECEEARKEVWDICDHVARGAVRKGNEEKKELKEQLERKEQELERKDVVVMEQLKRLERLDEELEDMKQENHKLNNRIYELEERGWRMIAR